MNFGDAEAHKQFSARENLQNLFDRCFLLENCKGLREHYKALRRLELDGNLDSIEETVDISALAENLTIACDIICADTQSNFIFCGNETSCVHGNGRLLVKAILNLLSNAYLHGKGRLITVKTIEINGYIKIEVKNEGCFSADYGKGLNFVRKVCFSGGGAFFIERDIFSTNAIMILKKASAKNCKDFYVPDFCEYLTDRLSPVYVELFGMEYHNKNGGV